LEIALTTVLLVAGGLLTRSLANLFAVNPGLRAANLAIFHVPLPESRYPSGTDASEFFRSVQQRIEAIPGVLSASGTAALPFGDAFVVETPVLWFRIVGRETVEDEPNPMAWRSTALPRYHETLGVPVLAGRGFTEADDANASRVMLVNDAMARRYWRDESPVGATLELGNETWTVVGIVGNVRHAGLDVEVEPMAHLPQSQHPTHGLSFVARTSGDPSHVLPQLRQAVWSLDPNVPVTRVNTMANLVAESGSDERYRTLLMMVFAVAAVVVAAGGVFSVTAQGVARQTRELGIRLALGAREHSLSRMVLRGSLITAVMGTTTGLLAAFWVTRLLSKFLFAIGTSDPLTYGLAATLLVGVCMMASVLPARRASRVDPVEVLKME
jgi:predicted permease